ncbi:putative secreted protein [Wickerhamomyces ciferrii]|uniref:Secreted protein n=1 Tax=Wickerhamomyces ciferrii (strain ATCC 14091 / BCRC 22168 / CBS 111 / JCM 3599 / NBRC 0793 / NRRL Y-1031 F-60-10) TaxID=1206466 RepID=K0KM42_WICCF|nr:uncharacterized protein BN7_1737 [Wickerhamomyces ciferrii]CCH42193.1 putative secreted protein [Wickerhamomyces ciferrii]
MITPRLRRLLILSSIILFVIYSLVSVSSSSSKESTNSKINSIRQNIFSYFNENDNNSLLRHISQSKIDLGDDLLNKELQSHIKDSKRNKKSQNFYSKMFKILNEQKFKIPALDLIGKADSRDSELIWSKKKLSEFLKLDPIQIENLQKIHQEVFNELPYKFPKDLYKGEGIVMIGGAQFSWLSLLSIKSLRSFGSKLPIELIIPTIEEYEQELCEIILPSLNGKCILLDNVFGEEVMSTMKFSGYQYKSLALIASSFDSILFMDSDNILVSNPDKLFYSKPFINHGMVLWPDYWLRTTSPLFYDIANINITNKRVRMGKWPMLESKIIPENQLDQVPLHDLEGSIPDLSSESGQLMIRKSDHLKTILLSFFYNLYGPNFFYKLLSQGQSGEGDKDTFIAAAIKSNEKFYQVKSEIQSFGWFDDGNFQGVSMGQRSPIEDYEQYERLLLNSKNENFKGFEENFDTRLASVFTVHANFPKFNPYLLWKENKLKNSKGEEIRLYSDISKFLVEPFDFELVQYKRMKSLLCDLKINLKYFENVDKESICKFIDNHIDFLIKNPVT